MKNPTMLYKCPGPEVFEGVACQTTIVDEEDVAAADGWHRNWIEAGAAHAADLEKLQANEAEMAQVEHQLAGDETAAQSAPAARAKKAKA